MAPDRLSRVFGALADPTRRAILARLTHGEATVGELAAPFEMSQPAISRHIKVLEDAGLVSRTRLATARISHLRPDALGEVMDWLARIDDAGRPYQRSWSQSAGALDQWPAPLKPPPTLEDVV
jgi:DNA-binding transcriptional ArsR family regulator